MGYSTDFEGVMKLTPPLLPEQEDTINAFCEERHGGNTNLYDGMPGFWCNWETDGHGLRWNGNEKTYELETWLALLIEKFFSKWGVKVKGKMLAQGEDPADRWTLEVGDDQKVVVKQLPSLESLGITY